MPKKAKHKAKCDAEKKRSKLFNILIHKIMQNEVLKGFSVEELQEREEFVTAGLEHVAGSCSFGFHTGGGQGTTIVIEAGN
jgi:hypothetical protein